MTCQRILADWIENGKGCVSSIIPESSVTYNTQHSTLHTGKGLDWIWDDGSNELS
jgi:hypothetical protein